MSIVRSERVAAMLLAFAAILGLVLANTAVGSALFDVRDAHFAGIDLSVGHGITDGLLAVFFLLAAIELRHELTHGELDSPRKALVPAVAAVGGVVAPALLYLAIVHDPALNHGWPVPTATDIAFALGVLALVGRGLPTRVRAFLLALAVLDDLVAILIIAFLFTSDLHLPPLLIAIPVVAVFGFLSTRVGGRFAPLFVVALILLGIAAWVLVYLSGVHPTIAGVALGLVMAPRAAQRTQHTLEPWSNLVILPLFAFTASLVLIPDASDGLSPVFWGVLIALPVGKLVGISGATLIARLLVPRAERSVAIRPREVAVVATLGGIGFTVSLLMNDLAFRGVPDLATKGTLGVLCGSGIAVVIGTAVTAIAATRARRSSGR